MDKNNNDVNIIKSNNDNDNNNKEEEDIGLIIIEPQWIVDAANANEFVPLKNIIIEKN